MHRRFLIGFLVLGCMISFSAHAENLLQIYQQALKSDPAFKKAEADWLSAKQNLPIAQSGTGAPGSGLYPYMDLIGNVGRSYQDITTGNLDANGYFNSSRYQISLTQPIFNYATWKSISSARYTVRAATATYLASAQDLMYRVVKAYLDVLNASDQLHFVLAQKKSFLQELVTTQQKFDVGLIAATGVYDAKASYDRAVAEEVKDRNDLQNQLENLRAITGISYPSLMGLNKTIPLTMPKPQRIEQWVSRADQQNYFIQSYLYSMLAAREIIKKTAAASYPTVNANAAYGMVNQGYPPTLQGPAVGLESTTTRTTNVNLSVDFPLFQGGYVSATTKKAQYQYLAASDQLELMHRDVVKKTRQAYWGVESGITQIQADQEAIRSARNKLAATQAGYEVGTRTMVDVLDAVTELSRTEEAWAADRYHYVLSIVILKQQAGTLSPEDLVSMNRWFTDPMHFSLHQPIVRSDAGNRPNTASPDAQAWVGEFTVLPNPLATVEQKQPLWVTLPVLPAPASD